MTLSSPLLGHLPYPFCPFGTFPLDKGNRPPGWGRLIKTHAPEPISLRLRGVFMLLPLYRPPEKRLTIAGATFIIEKNSSVETEENI